MYPSDAPCRVDAALVYVVNTYMERKLVAVGSSLAVTLPADIVKEFGLKKGQPVDVAVHPATGAVTIRLGTRKVDGGRVTRRFRARGDTCRQRSS